MKWKYCGRAKVLPEIMSKKSCEYCSSQCGLLSALSWMNKPLTIKLHWMGKKKNLSFQKWLFIFLDCGAGAWTGSEAVMDWWRFSVWADGVSQRAPQIDFFGWQYLAVSCSWWWNGSSFSPGWERKWCCWGRKRVQDTQTELTAQFPLAGRTYTF